ncbi:hypothetical protein ES332_D11G253900v1 [Gossypium tomentosum]|uniref:Uncharacterized protein n=1 Tax=Gossypium tomentosum TaxID=34277 RepID=A0A5D2ITT6_GOSTO|nr:hypothetical protein ES332_D11G253900v1 [Gossypium tomentosum]
MCRSCNRANRKLYERSSGSDCGGVNNVQVRVRRPYGDVEGSARAREGPGGCGARGSRVGKRRWELLGFPASDFALGHFVVGLGSGQIGFKF